MNTQTNTMKTGNNFSKLIELKTELIKVGSPKVNSKKYNEIVKKVFKLS